MTGAPFGILAAVMLEMHPTKMIGADMYIQAMRQDERDATESS